MRNLFFVLGFVIVALLSACDPPPDESRLPDGPGQIVVENPVQLVYASFRLLPGDTLNYNLSWSPGARATGYLVTVRATGTGWTGLPNNQAITGTTYALRAINTTAWDTTTFTAVVKSTNARGTSKDSSYVTWRVQRGPGSPGPIIVDSSQIQVALLVEPRAVTVVPADSACRSLTSLARWPDHASRPDSLCIGKDSTGLDRYMVVKFCGYFQGLDGFLRFADGQNEAEYCRSLYDRFPENKRLSGYPVATGPSALNQSTWKVHIDMRLADAGTVEARPRLVLAAK